MPTQNVLQYVMGGNTVSVATEDHYAGIPADVTALKVTLCHWHNKRGCATGEAGRAE